MVYYICSDFHGRPMGKLCPVEKKEPLLTNSVYLCAQVYLCLPNPKSMVFTDEEYLETGFPNANMLPDIHTLSPWLGGGYRVLCDVEPELSPRGLCRKMLQTFRKETDMGIVSAFEYEFFLGKLTDEKKFEPAFGLDCYSIHSLSTVRPFIDRLVEECSKMTPPIELSTVETDYGRGQLETPLVKAPGIMAADDAFSLKHLIKQLARDEFDQLATFTSKISFDSVNSGCASGGHFNFSLFPFTSKAPKSKKVSPLDLEKQAHFIAGVLDHCSAIAAICSPSPPCYHRRGQWSPVKNNYGFEDRTACIRGKSDNRAVGDGENNYFELRLPSSAANPYLVLLCVVAAGLDGIRKRTETVIERPTPVSLGEALECLEKDPVICEALGIRFVKAYTSVKRAEIDELEWMTSKDNPSQAGHLDARSEHGCGAYSDPS